MRFVWSGVALDLESTHDLLPVLARMVLERPFSMDQSLHLLVQTMAFVWSTERAICMLPISAKSFRTMSRAASRLPGPEQATHLN
jgi:hypothetical protein